MMNPKEYLFIFGTILKYSLLHYILELMRLFRLDFNSAIEKI